MNTEFSMVDSIRFGWRALWPNRFILAQVIATFLGIMFARGLLMVASQNNPFLLVVTTVVVVIAEVVVGVGFINISLHLVDGKPVQYRDLFLPVEVIVRYIAANLLAAVIIMVGFLLLIVPGIYAMLRFSMVRYAALEEEGNAFAALKRSSQLTDGIKWRLLGFMVAIVLINLLGAVVFFVGLIVTIPLSAIAMAHLYRELTRLVPRVAVQSN